MGIIDEEDLRGVHGRIYNGESKRYQFFLH